MRNPEADLRISVPDKSGAIPRAGRNCARNAERYGTIRGTTTRVEQGNNRKEEGQRDSKELIGAVIVRRLRAGFLPLKQY